MNKKKVARIALIACGILFGLFVFVGIPLITKQWLSTVLSASPFAIVFLGIGIFRLIEWAWSN